MVMTPVMVGVKVAEQSPPERLQLEEGEKLPPADEFVSKVTVPVGISVAPPESDTVAVHTEPWLT